MLKRNKLIIAVIALILLSIHGEIYGAATGQLKLIITTGDENKVSCSIEYIDPAFYDESGYPAYYIGSTVTYSVTTMNLTDEALSGLTITAIQEYYETKLDVVKGQPLPGSSMETWYDQAIPAGGQLILEDIYYIPDETVAGLNQTHVIVLEDGIEIYNNSEAGIWCPPSSAPTSLKCADSGVYGPALKTIKIASLSTQDTVPCFSAVFNDPDSSDTANMYRIQVSKTSGFSSGVVWDSGQVSLGNAVSIGQRCEDITYNGGALESGRYYWRIKFWDNTGKEGMWSEEESTNYFEIHLSE